MGKVSYQGFSIDNTVFNIFTSYNRQHYNLTFLIDLVLEVFLGEPLLGFGHRRAALSIVCALALLSVIPLGPQLSQVLHYRASVDL